MQEAIEKIETFIKNKKPVYVVTPNVDHIVKLQSDDKFKEIYSKASLILADGMPLMWASKFLRTPIKERVPGSDLFPEACKMANERGYKVFLLGGSPGSAQKSAEVLKKMYSEIRIAGVYSPPYGFENNADENSKIVNMIKDSRADILFVGLGAPKQEKWIYLHKNEYQVPVSIGVGASFEFISGMIKRAPRWMQKSGLEWFWRLMMEPGRLWKRYLVDDTRFFRLVFKQRFHK
ncbi:MAG: WecB/TagA/CpsF family glycosyltransferase [Candidatus Omnitrophica bacterium]|nr:WecB/TagA/CpsF family glycosyltransferase [Candidatus Omnitrophota bacterium]